MGYNNLFVWLILLMMALPLSTALEYSAQVSSPGQTNEYEGGIVTLSATITNNAGTCGIRCGWVTTAGQGDGIDVAKGGGQATFNFQAKAEGTKGSASGNLIITCVREDVWYCASGQDQKPFSYSFSFLYAGDGVCTTNKEKCATYQSYLAESSCTCSSTTQCNPSGGSEGRSPDNKGCITYCGNKIVEKPYETCNNCPGDVGKCDGLACSSAGECEGKYCVHNLCNHLPYVTGDGFCDTGVGESCKNSGSDCACSTNQRCGSSGICETYCGNSICEASEQGVCKSDCKWCGDGQCNNKEDCSSCQNDCGVCENKKANEEVIKQTQSAVQQGLDQAKSRQKTTTFGTIGVIVLFILGYLLWKYNKHKKSIKKSASKERLSIKGKKK